MGIQQFVFAKMIDYLRKVSNHVTIGRAYKHGTQTPNYFLLSRAIKTALELGKGIVAGS